MAILLAIPAASANTIFLASRIHAYGPSSTDGKGWDPGVGGGPFTPVFASEAGDLVANDGNVPPNWGDVFARTPGTTSLLSRQDIYLGSNTPGEGYSFSPSVALGGCPTAFSSGAADLPPGGDGNGKFDIIVRTCDSRTIRASLPDLSDGSAGSPQAVGGDSWHPSIDLYGLFVGFESGATNLVAGDTNGVSDVFLRSLQAGKPFTLRVSLTELGHECSEPSGSASVGWKVTGVVLGVVFNTECAIIATDTNGVSDVYRANVNVNDWLNGANGLIIESMELISAVNGFCFVPGNGPSSGGYMERDGNLVGFQSDATDLDGIKLGPETDIFLHSHGTVCTTDLVTPDSQVWNFGPSLGIGFLLYQTYDNGNDLDHGLTDANNLWDIYCYDFAGIGSGDTGILSRTQSGAPANGHSVAPVAVWDTAQEGVFESIASNLMLDGSDVNGAISDVFYGACDFCTPGGPLPSCADTPIGPLPVPSPADEACAVVEPCPPEPVPETALCQKVQPCQVPEPSRMGLPPAALLLPLGAGLWRFKRRTRSDDR